MALGLALTPDRLVGRVSSVRLSIAMLAAPLGPLVAGLLLASVSPRATIAVLAVVGLLLAVWGTLSPALREPPPLDALAGTSGLPPKSPGVKSVGSPNPGGLLGDAEGPTPNS
jgi:MFS family permease